MHVPPSILSSFVMLLVTIGPIETAVVFASLTAGIHRGERLSLAARSTTIAGVVLLLFAIGGTFTLGLLGGTGADVIRRISGVLLAGLAIQFIFDGLERAPFLH